MISSRPWPETLRASAQRARDKREIRDCKRERESDRERVRVIQILDMVEIPGMAMLQITGIIISRSNRDRRQN